LSAFWVPNTASLASLTICCYFSARIWRYVTAVFLSTMDSAGGVCFFQRLQKHPPAKKVMKSRPTQFMLLFYGNIFSCYLSVK